MRVGFFDARFAAYLAVAALLIVTPGPDTALVTRNALLAGRRAAAMTALGIGAGSVVWALASVGGVAVLLERSTFAFTLFKYAGAAYLAWLGLRSLFGGMRRGKRAEVASAPSALPAAPAPPPSLTPSAAPTTLVSFRQGLLSNLLNPKAGAIFATALPQFIIPGDAPARLLVMLVAYEAILLVWLNVYAALVSRAGRSRMGERMRVALGRLMGVALIALGVRLALERP
jgi:threonine/homoserine/homoserine lactone efflux protein